jgi:hypothetical protein
MRLLTSQRENLLGVSQEQGKRGDVELRPCLMVALEIEPSPYGCSSLNKMAEEWWSITLLACPMPNK